MACTCATCQLPKVVREWCGLYILTWKCASRQNCVPFSTCRLPRVVREWCALYILTWKYVSRHNGVHFFNVATSKSSEAEVFCIFWLRNVLRGTTACNCSSLIWPDGPAPAALARLFFDPLSHKSLEKHSEARLSYLFAHLHLLSFHFFSSLIFSLLLFSSLTLPTSAFPTGSFTSKLPSINCTLYRDRSCDNSLNLFQQFGSESKEWKGKYEAIPAEELNTVQKQLLCSNQI